jgi:probable phosphomutase (TIGR03848 family)
MATVILVRHGRSTANASGVLAGRLPGVKLDDRGHEEATATASRLAGVRLAAAVTSPLERCKQTARAITSQQAAPLGLATERKLTECDYGDWQGRPLKDLAKEPMWRIVQSQPSAAVFPGGESMRTMQDRAVEAVRRHDRLVEEEHGPGAVWVAVSHGDVIKAILADALGTHLDLFQRIHVDPASASIVRYTDTRPYVLGTNTSAGDLSWLTPPPSSRKRRPRAKNPKAKNAMADDAVVGGGAGPGSTGHTTGRTAGHASGPSS